MLKFTVREIVPKPKKVVRRFLSNPKNFSKFQKIFLSAKKEVSFQQNLNTDTFTYFYRSENSVEKYNFKLKMSPNRADFTQVELEVQIIPAGWKHFVEILLLPLYFNQEKKALHLLKNVVGNEI